MITLEQIKNGFRNARPTDYIPSQILRYYYGRGLVKLSKQTEAFLKSL